VPIHTSHDSILSKNGASTFVGAVHIKLYSYREDLVSDLFLGRGTTALACVELGRRFRGGDRSATYVAIAEERVALALEREPAA
jgi:DNA modification methylase